ncbi:MAG: dihydroorotate dehydrogenase electron transfer subunit [Candidatus Micrarchaeota archaeon]
MKFGDAKLKTGKITNVSEENYRIKTFEIDVELTDAVPGQYIMAWIPNVSEKPIGIAKSKPLTISVANVGPFSAEMHKLKKGDLFTFKGPFGKGFELKGKQICLVGGGYGVVPLYSLAQEAKENGVKTTVIIGAREKKDLVYEKKFESLGCKVLTSTDDGSCGFKGNAVQCLTSELEKGKFDQIYSCGPEKMMYFLAKKCDELKIPCQLSLERYMKCGIGICGSCDLNGKSVCRDGPVFNAEDILKMGEFGKVHRGASGKKEDY